MSKPLNLVLCWHMHQPYYREGLDGNYRLPWVYLHGIKDYDDMAAHLERYPEMRAVVNFAPVLLEQLDDYASQLQLYLEHGKATGDPMLNWLAGVESIPADREGRKELVLNCRRAHAPRMIDPYPQYLVLHSIFDCIEHEAHQDLTGLYLDYLDEQYYIDLITWYHLTWMSYRLKQTAEVKHLIEKGKQFDQEDRLTLLRVIHEALAGLIPRYRALAEREQIELSMTPYGHPIIPLLNDLKNMRDAQPKDPMPGHPLYPDGLERSRWHLQEGIRVFKHYFGRKPKGVWLSEGGVSTDAVALLDEMGIGWTASGEAVWHNSCNQSKCDSDETEGREALFMPYRLNNYKPRLFFRDDGLSDLIGFEYSKWHADDAVANFLHHLENIADTTGVDAGKRVVSVILDGENAWEYYPDNGHYFLDALYKALAESDRIRVCTFSDAGRELKEERLDTLVAGSWVYGTFSTWIGSEDKNRAWDLLVEAKLAYDKVISEREFKPKQLRRITRLLAVCEGSDWFWWFGDYNSAESVRDFDQLYRLQLQKLYQLLELPIPESLETPISYGGGEAENAGTMRRNA